MHRALQIQQQENKQLKSGQKKSEQTPHQQRYTGGKWAYEKMLNIKL